jgi:hypothetical protein
MLPSRYSCPRCKCRACYALHRKGLDWILSVFGLRPARCLTCNRKFYARYRVAGDGKFVLDGRSDSDTKSAHEMDQAA